MFVRHLVQFLLVLSPVFQLSIIECFDQWCNRDHRSRCTYRSIFVLVLCSHYDHQGDPIAIISYLDSDIDVHSDHYDEHNYHGDHGRYIIILVIYVITLMIIFTVLIMVIVITLIIVYIMVDTKHIPVCDYDNRRVLRCYHDCHDYILCN